MKEPSDARKRTLALQGRALRFSAGVNSACPKQSRDTPSTVVWDQLVRSADSASNNLIEADFLHKMRTALREVKEARACLVKVRLSSLEGFERVAPLEREADELSAIFATIVLNTVRRLEREKKLGKKL